MTMKRQRLSSLWERGGGLWLFLSHREPMPNRRFPPFGWGPLWSDAPSRKAAMAAFAVPVRVMGDRGKCKRKEIQDRKRLAVSG
jgi:hypothetical protein